MFDQHNVASSVSFPVKAKVSNLTSLISGTLAVIFLNVIFARTSPPRRRPFWARPLKTEHAKLIVWRIALKKLVLDVLLEAFLKKRIVTLITTEKRRQVLKVTHCFFFSSCFNF